MEATVFVLGDRTVEVAVGGVVMTVNGVVS